MLTLAFERDADSYSTPRVILSSRALEIAAPPPRQTGWGTPAAAWLTAALLLLEPVSLQRGSRQLGLAYAPADAGGALQAFYQLWEYGLQLKYHSALDIPVGAGSTPYLWHCPLRCCAGWSGPQKNCGQPRS